MLNNVRRVATGILDFLFPPRCPMCDTVIPVTKKGNLCKSCEEEMDALVSEGCLKCGRKIRDEREAYCKSCKTSRHVFLQGKILLEYEGKVRDSLHRFKYANRRDYAKYYGKIAAKRYGSWITRMQIDLIVPVPMYRTKKWFRGYNQAEVFAKRLSEETGIACCTDILRVKNTKPQAGMSRLERKNNLQNAFKISTNVVKYKRILVVDDIYTTGSTVDELARCLLQEEAYQIYVLCIASGEG